ncbi:MAG: hypothetical protein HC886_19355 [Leptolyngbyaceae cyanobacterium SM1_1_3]|nr:hypothetical protein [Leptolyngbyaceae cyanobacterium SM1_1_3]NJM84938.1 hypothetical protein [Leptolyngbyaceae cyanobacterium RM2_2_21]NJN04939.1 hypothetical protein [Leptolyngbyaceae cyanobacterium RM1_1_2]NJO11356.1 hypothetical protein [Leptolyngbyaceae cyanobacterium SL_1_1]
MADEQKRSQPGDPKSAGFGKGAPGSQHAATTAQTTDVNPPDMKIPAAADVEGNIQDIEAVDQQEAGTGLSTTGGYVIDEAGRLDNYAVEPPMRVEGQDE